MSVGPAFPDSTEALVAAVVRHDGTPAVLKVVVPRVGDHLVNEVTALRLAEGRGCARLLLADPDRGALLLERLGTPLSELRLPMPVRHGILCATASQMSRPARGARLPSGADKARRLVSFISETWRDLDRPCSAGAVEQAFACASRRLAAHDDERAVLVHGDLHQWNALQAGTKFKLVDPDGLLAEPEYDMGVVMREDPEGLDVAGSLARAHRLAALTRLDARAIWEWGVVERVSTGLLLTNIDLQPVGREMLAAADRIAVSSRVTSSGAWEDP
jgi:streptomycin 6-kinase